MRAFVCLLVLSTSFGCGPELAGVEEERGDAQAVGALATTAATGNLVRNGNFERASPSGVTDWAASCARPVALSGDAKFDSHSLAMNDEQTNAACAAYSTPFAVTAGSSYLIEAWAKWSLVVPGSANPAVYVYWYDAANVELKHQSVSFAGTGASWSKLSVKLTAPTGSVSAKVMLYSFSASAIRATFDGVAATLARAAPPGEVVRYVAPSARGSGSGQTPADAAKYNSASLWSSVQTQLASTPVRVVWLAGEYSFASSSDALTLKAKGHAVNTLSLVGEDLGSVRLVASAAATAPISRMLVIDASQNIDVENLHLRSKSAFNVDYVVLVTNSSKNIHFANISSVDTKNITYGVLGMHYGTNNASVVGSEFLRVGYDLHQHFVYAFRNVSALTFSNNVFEDSTGAYLRCRDTCSGIAILNSDFRATGTWGSSDASHFIEWAVFNDKVYTPTKPNPGEQEYFLGGFTAVGNRFDYFSAQAARAIPFSIFAGGYKPFDGTQYREHLLSAADANVLLQGSVSSRRSLVLSKYKLDTTKHFTLSANTYRNARIVFELESRADYGAAAYYPPADSAGCGSYDISALFP